MVDSAYIPKKLEKLAKGAARKSPRLRCRKRPSIKSILGRLRHRNPGFLARSLGQLFKFLGYRGIGQRFKPIGIGLILALAAFFPLLEAVENFQEKVTGAAFPKEISFTRRGRTYYLQATGGAVRRKWFTNGYVIAHYMQDPIAGTQEAVLKDIFSDDKAKQMTILWLHRLPLKLIQDSFRESLQKVLGSEEGLLLKDSIEKFVNFFKADAEVQDQHYIRWFPGGDVELWYRSPDVNKQDEKLGSLVSAGLAKALWTIWLGPDSVVDRNELMQFSIRK